MDQTVTVRTAGQYDADVQDRSMRVFWGSCLVGYYCCLFIFIDLERRHTD